MIIFNAKSKLHGAVLGTCIVAYVGDSFPPLVISDNFIVGFNKSRGVLFPNFRKSSYYFFSTKFIELMGGFSSINSQTTKSRPYFFGINRRAILTIFFSPLTKFRKSTELSNESDTIFLFSNFSKFFQMIGHKWKITTIQQKACRLVGLSNRITCFSSTLCIRVNTLKNEFRELFLSICKKLFFISVTEVYKLFGTHYTFKYTLYTYTLIHHIFLKKIILK